MAAIEGELLFKLEMQVTGAEPVGVGPHGTRVVAYVKGKFEGPGLKGEVVNGADWFLLRPDGLAEIDVRLTLKTGEGDFIYMHYTGVGDIPKAVLDATPPGELPAGHFSLRTAVRFERAAPKHARLSRVEAVGVGSADTAVGAVSYNIYAL